MSLQNINQPFSKQSALRIFGCLLLVVAVAAGGYFGWKKYKARPLTVAATKEVIRDYLEEHAGVRKFTPTPMEIIERGATNEAAASPPSAEAADSRKSEKKKKKSRPPHEQMARAFRQSVKEASDYKTIYRLIGENLARADQLLAARDPEQTEAALLLSAEASRAAVDWARNGWLAARIAEAYLWPNLGDAPASAKGGIDAASLLDVSEEAFDAAGETDNLVRNYQLLIARSDRTEKADKFRVRLAKLLQSQQNFGEALRVLREVQDTNNPSVLRRIASVEMMLQQTKTSN